ncbi:MAG: uroporphyrinogen-III C-methyltransferase [Chloroflexi bacterium]|nr:uroporphyrinogen-III C-methyltransferase [Chloroflexota bacterium]
MKTGKVYLVGAGPGDPGLISQKGLECLAQADVIIYDRLVYDRLLEWARPGAEKIYVGKAAGEHASEQDDINRLLAATAKQGKTIVRLKGGDPFVLGRGGEEAETLADEGIPFEIVPGVSSAVAVPAYAGIPLTHRRLASSFAVITGHEDPGKEESNIAWEKLATGVDTLVFLMGMRNLPEIAEKLLAHGRPASTPVAVISHGTTPEQETVIGTLADIVAEVERRHLAPPAVIVVGEVVRLRDKLRWFDNRPLFGKRILVTRARHQASALSKLLRQRGALPIELPTIDIEPIADAADLDRALSDLKHYQWIVFTSANGVDAFFQRLRHLNRDSRALSNAKVAAIGPATAAALAENGITPDYMPEVHTSRGLVDGLRNRNIAGQRFLLPRADIAAKELTKGLVRLGADVHDIAAYRTVPAGKAAAQARQALLSRGIDVITFTSSSTVSGLLAALGDGREAINRAGIVCIGPITAEAAVRAGLKVDIVATEHTIPGLVAAIERHLQGKKEA